MSSITHSFSEQTTRQTVLGTVYTTVLSHAAGNFVAGGKYLISVTALCDGPNATDHIKMQIAHGGVAFASSEYTLEPTGANRFYNYSRLLVWQAVGGESIDFQISCSNAAGTVGADLITIEVIRLDVDLIEGVDWILAEDSTVVALTTTPLDGASLSFSSVVSSNWLVVTTSQISVSSVLASYASQLSSSGTYNDTEPKSFREGEDVLNKHLITLPRVFNDLGAAIQTYKEQSYSIGLNAGQRLYSSIFALNLTKFRDYAHSWEGDDETLSGLDWDNLFAGLTYNPSIATDSWILASGIYVVGDTANEVVHRLRVDSVDQPDGQTLERHLEEEGADNTDELVICRQTVEAMTASNHLIEWTGDGGSSQIGGPVVRSRTMVIISMELSRDLPAEAEIPYQTNAYTSIDEGFPYESCGTRAVEIPAGSTFVRELPVAFGLVRDAPAPIAFSRQTPRKPGCDD